VFLGSVLLTIVGFFTASFMARARANRIREAADTITASASPAITKLTGVRSSLRHLELVLDDCLDQIVAGGVCDPVEAVRSEQQSVRSDWNAYVALPTFPREHGIWPGIQSGLNELDAEIGRIDKKVAHRDLKSAQGVLDQALKPTIDRLDERVGSVIVLNAKGAEEAAETIRAVQTEVRHEALALQVLSALCGLVAALIAVKLARAHTRLLEDQVTQLELFSGRVAHDLLGPLSTVGLALDLAARRSDDSMRGVLERAQRTLLRAREVMDGLLLLASAMRDSSHLDEPEVRTVLDDVLDEWRPSADRSGIALELFYGRIPAVACSAGVLANIAGNLVSNAIKYMGTSSVRRVSLRVSDRGENVRLEVSDTGPGVPSTVRGSIFDVFVRSAPTGVSGLGLGLATVRRFAQVLGGSVGVDSDLGVGTVVWVEIPRWEPAPPRLPPPGTRAALTWSAPFRRVRGALRYAVARGLDGVGSSRPGR
jgi:signal transduction histidine kinase